MDATQQLLAVAEEAAGQLHSKVAAMQQQLDTSVADIRTLQQQVWLLLPLHSTPEDLIIRQQIMSPPDAPHHFLADPIHEWLSFHPLKRLMVRVSVERLIHITV